jgi:hypothetical protein
MTTKMRVLGALVALYEYGSGTLAINTADLASETGIPVAEVQAVIHQLWLDDYLAYENNSYRLTEQGYQKYARESGPADRE